jgi:hypothetical protein
VSEPVIRDEQFVSIFASSNFDAESEADVVHGLLQSSGIESMIVRQNVQELPAGVVEVRVLSSRVDDARRVIEASLEASGATED